ncbi:MULTISPECIES: hypothetical protein [Photorhabdus]|nr:MULTISPECIES: hypothetical protein [unclassified Photorhabdus]
MHRGGKGANPREKVVLALDVKQPAMAGMEKLSRDLKLLFLES